MGAFFSYLGRKTPKCTSLSSVLHSSAFGQVMMCVKPRPIKKNLFMLLLRRFTGQGRELGLEEAAEKLYILIVFWSYKNLYFVEGIADARPGLLILFLKTMRFVFCRRENRTPPCTLSVRRIATSCRRTIRTTVGACATTEKTAKSAPKSTVWSCGTRPLARASAAKRRNALRVSDSTTTLAGNFSRHDHNAMSRQP